jgi:hypothetical protein
LLPIGDEREFVIAQRPYLAKAFSAREYLGTGCAPVDWQSISGSAFVAALRK